MTGGERAGLRRLIDEACRRRLGQTHRLQPKLVALPVAAVDAAGGDPELALWLAVAAVRAKQTAA